MVPKSIDANESQERARQTMTLENLRIFISYPRGGAAHTWAEAVQAHLAGEGARAWRDETGVAEGDPDWSDRIEGELRAADLLVAIVGMDSEVCRWQKRELVTADGCGKPVVALRIDARARMPFAICETQPVEARPDRAVTLATLAETIARAAPAPLSASNPTDAGANATPPEQRRAEVAWLENLIYRELTDRAALYVPLEGIERNSPAAERALKKVRIPIRVAVQGLRRTTPRIASIPPPDARCPSGAGYARCTPGGARRTAGNIAGADGLC